MLAGVPSGKQALGEGGRSRHASPFASRSRRHPAPRSTPTHEDREDHQKLCQPCRFDTAAMAPRRARACAPVSASACVGGRLAAAGYRFNPGWSPNESRDPGPARAGGARTSLPGLHPDVPEPHRVPVVLEPERAVALPGTSGISERGAPPAPRRPAAPLDPFQTTVIRAVLMLRASRSRRGARNTMS